MKHNRAVTARWRATRAGTRRSRALHEALVGASPALRDELLELASRD